MKYVRVTHGRDPLTGRVADADTGETVDMVRSARVNLSVDSLPTARIEVFVAEVDVTVEADRVQWFGLDRVPVEALQAELARREAEHPPEVTG
ncbi:hypothetical protein [Lentzea sp. NPDC059081]|uniref:hypothetical protein n=1 Tax=Lentzea sp. NPDC059081 TaxID=3346719 RepID=UPI00367F0371